MVELMLIGEVVLTDSKLHEHLYRRFVYPRIRPCYLQLYKTFLQLRLTMSDIVPPPTAVSAFWSSIERLAIFDKRDSTLAALIPKEENYGDRRTIANVSLLQIMPATAGGYQLLEDYRADRNTTSSQAAFKIMEALNAAPNIPINVPPNIRPTRFQTLVIYTPWSEDILNLHLLCALGGQFHLVLPEACLF